MKASAFELGKDLSNKVLRFYLHQPIWTKYDLSRINLEINDWKTIKYLNENGDAFNADVDNLPSDKGGLYIFFIRCPIMPMLTDFPVYIGRAQKTNSQNLKKRCKEYFSKWAREDGRPKIRTLIQLWGSDLHLSYLEIDNNEDIIEFEEKLINSLLPPFNDEIPDKEIKDAKKAFQI